ncbi:TetR/AcrR family transcriptional regulator [Nocardia sp. NPDC058058]|uniref:TetR/AcrR family transcriptional regulator n=1 Tax=Nocardia sp. NPDC058058 TaxID=3346317 RepID=UPI0036DE643A
MSTNNSGAGVSLPVQERAWNTRVRILDAALSCLVELGYAATTVAQIQARAGVSRGSVLHQFPSRDALLVAAVQHVAAKATTEIAAQPEFAPGPDAIDSGVERLWATMQGPLFAATTELWVAARTSPELQAVLEPQERQLGRAIREPIARMFGTEISSSPHFGELRTLLVSSMRGISLTYAFAPRDPSTEPHLEIWKRLARRYVQSGG